MADEPLYSTADAPPSIKRKHEVPTETTTLPPSSGRRTGFSSGPISPDSASAHHPTSYNSVPPPPAADDAHAQAQNAKLRAQEIASRLLSGSSVGRGGGGVGLGGFDSKRARVENGGGFDSSDGKPTFNSASSIPISYGYGQGTSKKIDIPNGRVGVVIGKAGETIKYLQLQSGAKIQDTRDMDSDPNLPTRTVELMGTPEQIAKAEQLINDVLAEAEAGGSAMVSRRVTGQSGSGDQYVMKAPNNKVGLVIGKGGETIKNMQARTGARIQVIPLHLPPGDASSDPNIHIDGTPEQIEAAKQLIIEATSEITVISKEGSSEASRGGKQGAAAVDEEKKLPSSAKKTNDEIDKIFASQKRTKGDRVKSDKRGDALSVGAKKLKKKKNNKGRGEGCNFNGVASEQSSRPRKRTGDGLAVYTEDELGINKEDAGGTSLCPFDCSCCF